ncbi:MAG TPA: TIGR03936 family radical SAM-associated protein, partial [bacterium]|nr:TIGR03936 family radical SAM-associated protein [bacterium]
ALIDKWIPDDELLDTTDSVFQRGWNRVKLYFMIGHPTETDEDVEAIARLSLRVLERGRKHCPGAGVNVGVSTFVPKPFTPFQWERQIDMEETRHKQAILRRMMNVRGVKLRPHEAENSWLEGIVSRGDRSVGELFELAWKEGCRLDGWTEHFDFSRWERAVEKWGRDPAYLLRERPVDEPLPWDHIDIFIEKKFLQRDLAKAKREMEEAALTSDCRNGCHVCGVIHEDKALCNTMIRTYKDGRRQEEDWKPKPPPATVWEEPETGRMRFRFTKDEPIRLLSHLELQNSMQRTMRRAEIPAAYSNGYSPHMKLAFGDALPVGVSSEGEYGDVRLRADVDPVDFLRRLNGAAPAGVRFLAATPIERNAPSLTSRMEAARYTASLHRLGVTLEQVRERVQEYRERAEWPVEKRVKKKRRDKIIRYDLKELVRDIRAREGDRGPELDLVVGRRGGNLGRPRELLMALFELDQDGVLDVPVHKVDSFVEFDGRLVSTGSGWATGERFDPYAPAVSEAVA